MGSMKLVVFGLSISSSWGNGHATLWRALARGLAIAGHQLVFFERDTPFYSAHRDLPTLPHGRLVLYRSWEEVEREAERTLASADTGIVTSYCPDGAAASALVLRAAATRVFYDLDTPLTLEQLAAGQWPPYLPRAGLHGFDLVLSFTGGDSLEELRTRLGARVVEPLFGCVDPGVHRVVPRRSQLAGDLSYLGTYAADRQAAVERLLVGPARVLPGRRFVIAGALYPPGLTWPPNVELVQHLPPNDHAALYCSSALTLSVTRAPLARCGECPSARLFEAAACGVPVLSDRWPGIARFFEPGEEILVADDVDQAVAAIERPRAELAAIGRAARERALAAHTGRHRAAELVALCTRARQRRAVGEHA
jgi:spore maturation protein CgeB